MKYYYYFFFLLFSFAFSDAQEMKVIGDLRLISEIGIEKSLFKNWKIGAESTLKLEKNISRIDELDFDLDLGYSPLKFLSLGVGYRLAFNQKRNGTWEKKYRYSGELGLDYRIRRFKLDYRIRYQNVDDDFFQYEQYQPSRNILRNRARLKYNIPKIPMESYTYVELYGLLNKDSEFATKIKFALGARYNFKKLGKIKVFYRIDRELNSLYPFTLYNIGIGYTYDF